MLAGRFDEAGQDWDEAEALLDDADPLMADIEAWRQAIADKTVP
jgi:hypothetical protein